MGQVAAVESAIVRGLEYLQRNQKPSGEFACYRVFLVGESRQTYDSVPFPTALISTSLAYCGSPLVQPMVDRACTWLRSLMEPFGVWRYWPPPRPECVAAMPDVDDTAVISTVLRRNGVTIPNNRGVFMANRNRSGLFYTWIIPRFTVTLNPGYWWVASERWRNPYGADWNAETEVRPDDLDGVVNSNVISYLGPCRQTKPVCDYLIQIFKEKREATCDKWYQNPFIFYYAVARNLAEGFSVFASIRDEMITRIISGSDHDGSVGSDPMNTGQAACALLNLQANPPELDAAIDYLLHTQDAEGGWPYAHYYYGGPKRTLAWGSAELTTGFCLQALARYVKLKRG
jgi:hypothetical protein